MKKITFLIFAMLTFSNISIWGQCDEFCTINNSFFGMGAGEDITTGTRNSFFGRFAGADITTGSGNSFFGFFAGHRSTGSGNSFFGNLAGGDNTTGFGNSFFGNDAGKDNTTGNDNSFFGSLAGEDNFSGNNNSFFGSDAGTNNSTGANNSFFGSEAGKSKTTGNNNSFFGFFAGRFNSTGANNSFFGRSAGKDITSGSSNVCIGVDSGPNFGSGNVNNRLYIDIEQGSDPLIYGEFDNDFIKINGTFEVTAGLANPSSRELKQEFVSMDPSTVLAQLSTLDVQQWRYKHRPDEKHIGPVAEDFHELFGLGAGEKTISTIDADGVMMLAIQGLKEENEQLKSHLAKQDEQLARQGELISEIMKRLD